MTDYAHDAELRVVAKQALRRTQAIQKQADGRELTTSQRRDLETARADFIAAVSQIPDLEKFTRGLTTLPADELHDAMGRVGEMVDNYVRGTEPSLVAARSELAPFLTTDSGRSRAMRSDDFSDAIRDAMKGERRVLDLPLPAIETRAAWTTSGGSAVQINFSERFFTYLRNTSPVFDPGVGCTVVPTADGAPMVFPTVTTDAGATAVVAEGSAIGTAEPTFTPTTIYTFKYANLQAFTEELNADSVYQIQDIMARSSARSIGIGAGHDLTVGTGTVQPTGILGYCSATATATAGLTAAAFFDWQDLVSLYGLAPIEAQRNGVWQCSPTAFTKILKFKSTTDEPVFLPNASVAGGAPGTILGRPLFVNPALPAVGSASASVIFGDFSQYVIREGGGLRVEISKDWLFGSDQLVLKTAARYGGALLDAGAVVVLKSANA